MKSLKSLACCLLLFSLPSGALAEGQTTSLTGTWGQPPSQPSMFVGATLRLSLKRKPDVPRYHAALGISGMARNPRTSELQLGQGLKLALDGKSKPRLRLAGSNVGELWPVAKLDGREKTLLIVVGAAAVLGIAALAVVNGARCEDEGNMCD